jgi:hypothetical protein
VVEVLCEAPQHDIPQVRMGAAYTPGEIGDIRAAEPLPVTLRGENLGLEKTAAWVLSQIGGPRVPEVLCEALSQKDIVIIAGAYEFFVVHCPPGVEENLLEVLDHFEEDEMAELLLRSENPILRGGARQWARKRNHELLLDTFSQNGDD